MRGSAIDLKRRWDARQLEYVSSFKDLIFLKVSGAVRHQQIGSLPNVDWVLAVLDAACGQTIPLIWFLAKFSEQLSRWVPWIFIGPPRP